MNIYEQIKPLEGSKKSVTILLSNRNEISTDYGTKPFDKIEQDTDGWIIIYQGESTNIFRPELVEYIHISKGLHEKM